MRLRQALTFGKSSRLALKGLAIRTQGQFIISAIEYSSPSMNGRVASLLSKTPKHLSYSFAYLSWEYLLSPTA